MFGLGSEPSVILFSRSQGAKRREKTTGSSKFLGSASKGRHADLSEYCEEELRVEARLKTLARDALDSVEISGPLDERPGFALKSVGENPIHPVATDIPVLQLGQILINYFSSIPQG